MKTTTVTELVTFKLLETITEEQLLSKADLFNDFQKRQDGFIDAELVKDVKENAWCLICHYESMDKVKVIGENLRNSREFAEFTAELVPGSLKVSFHHTLKRW
jgi:hypothetical protein